MKIDIPFEINDIVYIIENEKYLEKREWVPPDYRLGGDEDGPFDRGHYQEFYNTRKVIKKVRFRFALLDRYPVNKIYKTYEDAHWQICLQNNKKEN